MPCLIWRALANFASSAAISASMSERMAAIAACSDTSRLDGRALSHLAHRAILPCCLASPRCVNLNEALIYRVSEPDMAIRLTEGNSVIAGDAGQDPKHDPPLLVGDESKYPIEVGRKMNEPPAHAEKAFGHDLGDIAG
jgi:hypothetical protein